MKFTLSTLALLTVMVLASTALHASPPMTGYTNASYTYGPYSGSNMYCSNFVLKQGSTTLMQNSSGAAGTPYNTFFSGVAPGNLIPGSQHTISVTCGGGYAIRFCVFIDYNNDGDFSDANELVASTTADIAGVLSANRRVLGMMPHPERVIEDAQGGADGSVLFRSLISAMAVA